MPYRAKRECTYPGCHTLVSGGRCSEHPGKEIVRDPAIKKLYNSKRWQEMRRVQLASHPWCAECLGNDQYTWASEVDHITRHKGNPVIFFDENNLQSLCKSHHSRKTAKEVW